MYNVRLKILNEGFHIDPDQLIEAVDDELATEGILLSDSADFTLKVKYTVDNSREHVLLQLRETASKVKLREKVIPFVSRSWLKDTVKEIHALVMQEELSV